MRCAIGNTCCIRRFAKADVHRRAASPSAPYDLRFGEEPPACEGHKSRNFVTNNARSAPTGERYQGNGPTLEVSAAHQLLEEVTATMLQPVSPHGRHESEFLMVVDDDPSMSDMLERVLVEQGYGTMHAKDGKAALEILQRGIVPSVILLDLMMPRMGGLEFVERLERDDTFCDIPVILMSGHAALARGNKVRNMHLLPKPFKPDELLRLVRTLGRQSFSRWVTPGVERMRIAGQR
jgi:CheY-like chemotaxis protein